MQRAHQRKSNLQQTHDEFFPTVINNTNGLPPAMTVMLPVSRYQSHDACAAHALGHAERGRPGNTYFLNILLAIIAGS